MSNDLDDTFEEELDIRFCGPEEVANLLEALKSGEAFYTPEQIAHLQEQGLTPDMVIEILTRIHKGNLN